MKKRFSSCGRCKKNTCYGVLFYRTPAKVKEGKLSLYKVDAENKKHEFWQRDSLAIRLYSSKVAFQKLKYIHNNPLAEHWQLAKDPM